MLKEGDRIFNQRTRAFVSLILPALIIAYLLAPLFSLEKRALLHFLVKFTTSAQGVINVDIT